MWFFFLLKLTLKEIKEKEANHFSFNDNDNRCVKISEKKKKRAYTLNISFKENFLLIITFLPIICKYTLADHEI